MSYTRSANQDLLPFEVAQIEAEADRKPLEPRFPWLSDAIGISIALTALFILFA